MHGDEPTHTVVLLELLNLLRSDHPLAAELLQNCRLVMIPMLNPDGAHAWTRRNAQGIDINRDARRCNSPEARVLATLIDDGQFDFAFNLHNQRRSRTIDGKHLAAISLLVPPADAAHTDTPSVVRAKSLGSYLRRMTEPHCLQKMSRYGAGFMPRCFGERVSASGVSTLLIEAGGCPELDNDWLTQLHFFALTAALAGIASSDIEGEGTASYESLPVANDQDLYDIVIRNIDVRTKKKSISNVDVGLLYASGPCSESMMSVEFGDLEGCDGREAIDGARQELRDGVVGYDESLSPVADDFEQRLDQASLNGVTTLVGSVALDDADRCQALESMQELPLPIRVGWVGHLNRPDRSDDVLTQMRRARELGLLAIVGDVSPEVAVQLVRQQQMPAVVTPSDFRAWHEGGCDPALGWASGLLTAENDLVIWSRAQAELPTHVIVRGILVVRDGQRLSARPGRVLSYPSQRGVSSC